MRDNNNNIYNDIYICSILESKIMIITMKYESWCLNNIITFVSHPYNFCFSLFFSFLMLPQVFFFAPFLVPIKHHNNNDILPDEMNRTGRRSWVHHLIFQTENRDIISFFRLLLYLTALVFHQNIYIYIIAVAIIIIK